MSVEVVFDLPPEWYYRQPMTFGMSQMLDFEKHGPAYFAEQYVPYRESDEKDSTALRFGRAAHCLLLEGESVFADQFEVGGPINEKTGKVYGATSDPYKKWVAKCGGNYVTAQEYDMIRHMGEALRANEVSAPYLDSITDVEVTFREEMIGWGAQCRFDAIGDNNLFELKTCADLDRFKWDFKNYKYDRKAAFYVDMARRAGYDREYIIIAVEKHTHPRIQCFRVAPETITNGIMLNEQLKARITHCINTDEWPLQDAVRPIETL